MPWLGIAFSLGWNYANHRHHRSTICGVTRRLLPWPAMVAAWGGFTWVMLRHLKRGYPLRH
jgi:hypothetical protein